MRVWSLYFTRGVAISVTLHLHKILAGNRSEERYEINGDRHERICV